MDIREFKKRRNEIFNKLEEVGELEPYKPTGFTLYDEGFANSETMALAGAYMGALIEAYAEYFGVKGKIEPKFKRGD